MQCKGTGNITACVWALPLKKCLKNIFLLRVCKGLVLGLAPFRCFQPMWTHLHIFTLQSHAFCLTQRWIINKATLSGFQNLHVRCLSVQRICSFHVKAKPLFIFFFQSNQHLQRRWHKKKNCRSSFQDNRIMYCYCFWNETAILLHQMIKGTKTNVWSISI